MEDLARDLQSRKDAAMEQRMQRLRMEQQPDAEQHVEDDLHVEDVDALFGEEEEEERHQPGVPRQMEDRPVIHPRAAQLFRRRSPLPVREKPISRPGGAAGLIGAYWHCAQCTVANEAILLQCMVCNAERPADVALHGGAGGDASGGAGKGARKAPSGNFICSVCTYANSDPSASSCEMCGTARESAAGGGGESKEDDEARSGHQFVMGQEAPPPLKREPLLREHLAFLAGIEEAFGHVHVAPALLQGVERLVRRPFEALVKQYGAAAASAPAASASPAKAGSLQGPAITSDLLDVLLKALVYRAAQQAMRAQRTLELMLACCLEEEEELRTLHCNMCGVAGSEALLHFSECGVGNQHAFCLTCTHSYVMELVESKRCGKVLCPFVRRDEESASSSASAPLSPGGPERGLGRCGQEVDIKFIRRCLSAREFQQYLDECFALMLANSGGLGALPGGDGGGSGSNGNYVRCPNARCNSIMEVAKPHGLVVPIEIKEVDDAGKPLSPAAWLHFSEFRVRCHACQVNFCHACKSTPYHMGRTCAEQASYKAAQHCRFCAEQLTPENTDASNVVPAFASICTAESCLQRREHACAELLPCGHPCPGVRGEKEHAPCLLDECPQRDAKLTVCATDLCAICWTEELGMAPVVKLTSCGHVFHAHCVADKLGKRWPGVRITFGFAGCSVCKVPMDHPYPPIQQLKQPIDQLWSQVRAKALARLSIEKMENDAKLIEPSSQFYKKPEAYAMASFAYYNCFKCKKFYFGGRRDCEQNAAAEVRPENEFVCFDCADLKSVKCKNKAHAEFLVWKCRFCCNLASWFCFGTTHYCEPCHKDNPMEKVKRKREGFKQCPGYQMCPCKMPHAPNGAEAECEFCVGCGACQEELSKQQAAKEKEKAIDKMIDDQLAGGGSSGAAGGSGASGSRASGASGSGGNGNGGGGGGGGGKSVSSVFASLFSK